MLASYEKKDIDKKELNVQLTSVVGKEVLFSAVSYAEDSSRSSSPPPKRRWRR